MAVPSGRHPAFARIALIVAGACALVLLGATGAQASIVTVGSPLTSGLTQTGLGSPGSITVANVALGEPGAIVASPVDGTIVRWRVTDFSGGPFRLRVLRPLGGIVFAGAGTSSPAIPTTTATETFPTNLPVKAGDLIGLDTSNVSDMAGAAIIAGSSIAAWSPALADGAMESPTVVSPKAEIAFNADIQPVPVVSSISPASGSIAGGTSVTLAGHDLSGATAVSFGGVPAAAFPVKADGEITVIAPKAAKPGPLDVTVTTPGGQSALVAADQFTYTACIVPKLKGKSLKSARKVLGKADCSLGKVKGKRGKSAKVIKQNPGPGKTLAPAAKVGITVK